MGVVPNDLYTAGTISLTNGSDIVTGDGTFWLAVAMRGDTIWVADRSLLVKEVLADDQIKLAAPWGGDTVADQLYALTYSSWLRYDTGELQGGVRDLIAFYRMGGVRGTREVTVPVDAITVDDLGKVVVYDSASAVDASIPEAAAGGKLVDGWACWIKVTGAGAVTLTPAVSTINGAAELLLVQGDSAMIWSHGGNYLAAVLHVSEDGDDGATIVAQDDEPDTDLPAGSLWIDANSADLDIYQLTGSPPEWVPLGIALKGSPGADGDDGVDGINGASALTVVRTVATANVNIASGLEAGDVVSGVTLAANDLVLLTAQTAPAENGIYVVSASGAAARHASFATYDSHPGCYFSACEGTGGLADTLWRCTSDRGGTLGTTALAFSQFTAGGDVAGDTHAAAGKSTPVDADELPLVDSAASNVLKKLTWANLKATLASWLVSAGWIRDKLTANRTYYVATAGGGGSNSNDGLSSGTPFLTIQKALDTVAALDLSSYNVTIQLADGTYTGGMSVAAPWVGSGSVTVVGNTTTPANVVISTAGDCVNVTGGGSITVSGMKLTSSGSVGLYAIGGGSRITLGQKIEFGSASSAHMRADNGGYIYTVSAYTISGGSNYHFLSNNGAIEISGATVTLSGTPAFSQQFAQALSTGVILLYAVTWSGSATGVRYNAIGNGVINTFGQATTWLPGNSAGGTSAGGQYL